jgi:hypothetical protein
LLYLTIDVCLIGGLFSLYVRRRHGMRVAGCIGFLLALVGLVAGRTSSAVTTVDLYPITATFVAVGVLLLALSEWRSARTAAWIPVTFALSLIAGGISMFFAGATVLFNEALMLLARHLGLDRLLPDGSGKEVLTFIFRPGATINIE